MSKRNVKDRVFILVYIFLLLLLHREMVQYQHTINMLESELSYMRAINAQIVHANQVLHQTSNASIVHTYILQPHTTIADTYGVIATVGKIMLDGLRVLVTIG